jgi:hypothetical protein
MSRHTITAEIERKFTFPGLCQGEYETTTVKVEITYEYSPGRRAYTPRGEYAPIDPPEPPEVSFVSAKLIYGGGLNPTNEQTQDWASDWLDEEEGFALACDHAEQDRLPDPDDAYDSDRDDRTMGF